MWYLILMVSLYPHNFVKNSLRCLLLSKFMPRVETLKVTTGSNPAYTKLKELQICFPQLLSAYATRKYRVWVRSLPSFFFIWKVIKSRTILKAFGALSEMQKYFRLYKCTSYYRFIKYNLCILKGCLYF